MKIVNYELSFRILGWPFFLIGVLGIFFVIVKMVLRFDSAQLLPFVILLSFAVVGWCCIHCDYCYFLPSGIDCREAKVFAHSKRFIPIHEIEKIQLEEKMKYNHGKGFLCANIVLYGKNGFKFEIKAFESIENQKKLFFKLNEQFAFHKLAVQNPPNIAQPKSDSIKIIKNSQLRNSLKIVRWESGQMVVGIIGSMGLSIAYIYGKQIGKNEQSLLWFMILWVVTILFKMIRYRIHLEKVRKNVFRLTRKTHAAPLGRQSFGG